VQGASADAPVQVAIVDEATLGMDAAEFAHAARSEPALANLALVLIAAGEAATDTDHLKQAGYTSILNRPVEEIYLFNALHAASAGHVPAAETPQVAELVDHHRSRRRGLEHARHDVLVAEDNKVNRKVISRILEQAGHRVTLVTNGREALDQLEERDFDVCIVDMQMPELGGVDTLKLFRIANPDRDQVPFIMLTANATTDALEIARQTGFDAYLTKPLDPKRLLQTISRVVTPSAAGAAPSPEPDRDAGATGPARAPAHRPGTLVADLDPGIDREKLTALSRLDAGGGFLREVLTEFAVEGNRLLRAMEEDLDSGRWQSFAEHAHELKGAARTVGAVRVARLVEAMGDSAARRSPADLSAALSALRDGFERSRQELGSFLRRQAD
jgi:two-component system sensor histidine kinase RpfC